MPDTTYTTGGMLYTFRKFPDGETVQIFAVDRTGRRSIGGQMTVPAEVAAWFEGRVALAEQGDKRDVEYAQCLARQREGV